LKVVRELKEGDDVTLGYDGKSYAIMHLEEKIRYNPKELAIQVYGTTDSTHPNVNDIYNMGEMMLGGKIDLIQRVSQESTPLETQETFKKRHWKTIAGYQTRNPPHMVHEYLQRNVMEKVDGLLIHPVIGKLKSDDFPPEAIRQLLSQKPCLFRYTFNRHEICRTKSSHFPCDYKKKLRMHPLCNR